MPAGRCPPPTAATVSRPAPACPAPGRPRPRCRRSARAHSGAGRATVRRRGRGSRAAMAGSGPGDLPDLVEAVAGLVAGLGVLGPEVQRLAFEGPLLLAVVARDHGVVAAGGVAGRGH